MKNTRTTLSGLRLVLVAKLAGLGGVLAGSPAIAHAAPQPATAPAPASATAVAADSPHGEHHHDGAHHPGGHHSDGAAGGPLVHRFENAAKWAKQFDDPKRDAWQKPKEIVAAMQIRPGMTVADIGAGTGYLLPHLAQAVGDKGKVLALDIEASMVQYMKERATRERLSVVLAQQVSGDNPQLPKQSVDRVLLLDVWHHVPQRVEYARKLLQGLTPGGEVYIVDFAKESLRGPPKHHRLLPEDILSELRAAGLTAQIVKESLPDQFIVVGKRPAETAPTQ